MAWHRQTLFDPSMQVANRRHDGQAHQAKRSQVGDWLALLLGGGLEWLLRSASAPSPAVLLEFKKRDVEIAQMRRAMKRSAGAREPGRS